MAGKLHKAWEDDHLVDDDSPDKGWYLEKDGRWSEDFTGGYVCNPEYKDRAYGAGFGLDWGNIGSFFTGFIAGFSKGGGDMTSSFINAGGEQTSEATRELKAEVIAARNRWLAERNIPIPKPGSYSGPAQDAPAQVAEGSFKAWLIERFGR